jgi:hypothetical protein
MGPSRAALADHDAVTDKRTPPVRRCTLSDYGRT